ncbi:efflux RND transporter periplasmic adaptor subunit [Arcticibacter eurypsychrophilus]|uniref:efflux RND transporter periplasmic adaptor subunit n=1 Tax=Arcticibacter eurypsychrophilus TaxID=1434752 RepID=UPI00084D5B95|nr:efflux RND transporter periplasmic adaptor subunit [Arcticibacter eurypsychrophilus]
MKIFLNTLLSIWTVILISACGNSNAPESNQEEVVNTKEQNSVELTSGQYKTANIQLDSVKDRPLSGVIKVNGMLDVPPQSKVSVVAVMGGIMKQTSLLQGLKVNKGQVIAVMQHPDYIQLQQDYLDNKSQLTYLFQENERQKELAKENVNSQKTLQQSSSNYQSMKARVQGLRQRLQMLNVNLASLEKGNIQNTINLYAPISGYVTKVNVNIGSYVNPSDVMFEIVDTEHLHAELTVFEKDIPKIKVGQKVRFTLANEDKERSATVYLIGREISNDRTVNIHCHLTAEDKQLLPGMYLKAFVEAGTMNKPSLPEKAIVDYQGNKYIFIVSPAAKSKKQQTADIHQFEMLAVKAGTTEGGYTEVLLPDNFNRQNNQIVTNGAYDLLAKMKNTAEEE